MKHDGTIWMMGDAEKKYLIHTGSAGPDHRVTSYYRWHGHKLQHLY